MPDVSKTCPNCGEIFVSGKPRQNFCSRKCQSAAANARRHAKTGKAKAVPVRPREPKDGLRCKICTDFIDSREGWRVNCKSCDRLRMLAWHNPVRCTLKGCIVCMNADLARSPEFVAAWEAESGNEP